MTVIHLLTLLISLYNFQVDRAMRLIATQCFNLIRVVVVINCLRRVSSNCVVRENTLNQYYQLQSTSTIQDKHQFQTE